MLGPTVNLEPIYFVLEGHNRILRPQPFIDAVRRFVKLLRELDASISRNPRGSVIWEIHSLQKSSPATVGFRQIPRTHKQPEHVPERADEVKASCVSGIALLSKKPERLSTYSERALDQTEHLAKLRSADRFDDMRVINRNEEAAVSVSTLANIQTLRGPTFESAGSVVGKLEQINVHHGFEFRVWSESTGKPVTCRFDEAKLDEVMAALRKKVVVHGDVKWNRLGHPIAIAVGGMQVLNGGIEPTIEEVSGIVEDFTDGMSLREYLEELRG